MKNTIIWVFSQQRKDSIPAVTLEQGSNLENPLGLIKSTDEGKSFKKLTLYGETDFHYLAASYNSKVIYALNEQPNSQLKSSGLFFTEDEGKSWRESKMLGFEGDSIYGIAAHPDKPNIVGIASSNGLFLSDDYGETFKLSSNENQITALEFQENSLLYSSLKSGSIELHKQDLTNQKDVKIDIPTEINDKNPVMFIASNPKNREEITLVTHNNEVLQTEDNGTTWDNLTD
ncbi:hypothetical protein D0469_05595 [Peribacillus saganii]|uniref:Sortilin N-terminal domain-containing protein n=1 Tax=Peribacillus saganii TaxID=2303992 RepID=A0A372LRS2_9BACI|nr:hypothetical protein D0469_05595 [Peribacillus saganii]